MTSNLEACHNCHFAFANGWHAFSSEHAMAFSPSGNAALVWCRNCQHVNVYQKRKFLGLIQSRRVFPTSSCHIREIQTSPAFRSAEVRGTYNELLRLIWHAFRGSVPENLTDRQKDVRATHLAMDSLVSSQVGMMLAFVCNAQRIVPLDQLIADGTYSSADGPFKWDCEEWLSEYGDLERIEAARKSLRDVDDVIHGRSARSSAQTGM